VVFGGIVVARLIDRVTWAGLLYASARGRILRTSSSSGWFGPRGLATIVFAVLVFDEKLPGNDTIMVAAGWTVLLSVVAHGVTANPLVKAIGRPSEEVPRNVRRPTTSR
jgi:sodium/hydrogen antiporter